MLSTIPIAIWSSVTATTGTRMQFTKLPAHKTRADKTVAPLFSPVLCKDVPPRRGNKHVDFVTALVVDLDKGDVNLTLERLAAEGVEHWAYTTHRHMLLEGTEQHGPKWRVIVPFTTPVPRRLWKRVWGALAERWAPHLDRSCSDCGRTYYVPSCAPENAQHACQFEIPGTPFNWTALELTDEPVADAQPLGTLRRELDQTQLAAAIMLVGLKFPELGDRHELALALGGALRRELISDAQIAQVIEAGFGLGGSDAPQKHATTALDSARATGAGDPTYGWATVSRILGSKAGGELRGQCSAVQAGINPELIRQKPQDWPNPESRSFAPLHCTPKGLPINNGSNAEKILSAHPAWADVLAYDVLAECVVCIKPPPSRDGAHVPTGPWTDNHMTNAQYWVNDMFGFEPGEVKVKDAIHAASQRFRFNPVIDYFETLKWDGTRRLDAMLVNYFGAMNEPFTRTIARRFMISAVARGMKPGEKVDTMLILEGKQGAKKSSAIQALCGPDWFSDSRLDFHSKDAPQAMRGRWIIEIPELDALQRAEMSTVKAFLTVATDRYRSSYGRLAQNFPRSSVFVGTTNHSQYLSDTDNRRFWPVQCGQIDLKAIARDRDQLWAEALEYYRAGEQWWLTDAEVPDAQAAQELRKIEDPWQDIIVAWFERERRESFHSGEAFDILQVPIDRRNTGTLKRLAKVCKDSGYETYRARIGGRLQRRYRPCQPVALATVLQLRPSGSVQPHSLPGTASAGVGSHGPGHPNPQHPGAVAPRGTVPGQQGG